MELCRYGVRSADFVWLIW